MKYFYDRMSDSLYLRLRDGSYGDSVEAAPGVVLDFDKEGRLLGIDLEHASRTVDVTDFALHEEPAATEVAATRVDGASLKRSREALGLSQADLAKQLSVSANTIARWERGELKIEHPAMLHLAISALRNGKLAHAGRVRAVSKSVKTLPASYERHVGRNSATGRFTSNPSRKTTRTSERERTRKK